MALKCVSFVLNAEWANFHYIRHTPSSNKVIKQACVFRAEYMNSLETHPHPTNKLGTGNVTFQITAQHRHMQTNSLLNMCVSP